jgi:hypothetical protein
LDSWNGPWFHRSGDFPVGLHVAQAGEQMTSQIQKSDPVSNCKRTFDHPASAISDPCRLEPGEAAALDLLAGRLLAGITTDRASAHRLLAPTLLARIPDAIGVTAL